MDPGCNGSAIAAGKLVVMNVAMIGLAAATLGGQVLLIVSVVRRIVTGSSLGDLLTEHGVLPLRALRKSPLLIELAQMIVGVCGVVTIVAIGPHAIATRIAGLCAGVVYSGFALYLTAVLVRRGGVRCGCLGGRERVGRPAIARAGLFAVASITLGAAGGATHPLDPMTRIGLLPAAATVIAIMAVVLVGLADAISSVTARLP